MEERKKFDNIAGSRIAFLNLGCKVNSYETEAMQQQFAQAGAILTEFEEEAEVYLINTCTVTNIADRKSRQMLHRAKHKNPDAVVAAVGCYAQAAGEALLSDKAVDVIIGTNHKKEAVEIINTFLEQKKHKRQSKEDEIQVVTENEPAKQEEKMAFLTETSALSEYETLELKSTTSRTRAYLKVQDGCNQFCSYCIIPYTRGRIRSRCVEEVCEEAKRLAQQGYQEIVLTGIHLSSYGLERYSIKEQAALCPNSGELPLLLLVRQLNAIEGIKRIRLGSLEPRIIREEFVKELANFEKVCPHFHLSLQSGCNETLARMNRKYTTEEYFRGCELLRQYFIEPALTTDVIVGFPKESEEEFKETCRFLRQVSFAQMHIFKFSPRKGTLAWNMPEQVSEQVKNERSDILHILERQMRQEFEAKSEGFTEEVLIEEEFWDKKELYYTGHTKRYEKIAVFLPMEGKNLTQKGNTLHNEIVSVLITPERVQGMRIGILQQN